MPAAEMGYFIRRYRSIPSSNRFLSLVLAKSVLAKSHLHAPTTASLLAIGQVKKMRGNTMPAATNYELNAAASVGPSSIASEEATLLASANAGDSAAFQCLVMPHWDALLRVTKPFFAIEGMRRAPFQAHFSMLSAI